MRIDMGIALTVFGLAFGAWAFIVKTEITKFRSDLEHFTEAFEERLKEMAGALNDTAGTVTTHITHTERRLTMLETEFGFLRRYMTKEQDSED